MIAHILGLDNGSGGWYLFWSGFGADFSELTLFGGLATIYLKHNCHVEKCWRIGRFTHEGFLLCTKHFPRDIPTEFTIGTSE